MTRQNKLRLRRQRHRKFFWLLAALAVSALLYEEQAAVLFVLSTLAICGLLIVVAFSNLEARDAEMQAAAIGADSMSTNSRNINRAKGKGRLTTLANATN